MAVTVRVDDAMDDVVGRFEEPGHGLDKNIAVRGVLDD
jgi:hypothetical protein